MGNLSTPKSVQKLQTALHAKAKAEAGYRFYALYDKISRDDILAHAYAQCRSNKGAPGVDGQEFADIEAYGVQRWLGELALALRQETYRPEPIRRVFIPKANGKLRPLGISTLRDRVYPPRFSPLPPLWRYPLAHIDRLVKKIFRKIRRPSPGPVPAVGRFRLMQMASVRGRSYRAHEGRCGSRREVRQSQRRTGAAGC